MVGSRTEWAIYRDSRGTAVRIGLGAARSSGSQKFEGESKGGIPRRKSATLSGTPMRRWPSDRIEYVKPVGDLPVTGADRVEIAREREREGDPGREIYYWFACSRETRAAFQTDKILSITLRSKCVKLQKSRDCSTIENESANIRIYTGSLFPVKTIGRLRIIALHVAYGSSSDKFAAAVI